MSRVDPRVRPEVAEALAAAVAGGLRVGVSYPWGTGGGRASYGWDFGGPFGPPPWRERLAADLRAFVAAGVDVVRWFVWADGLALGRVGAELRERAPGRWRFDPPTLGPEHGGLVDFRAMLEAFRAPEVRGRVRVLPVFVDGVELARASAWRRKYRPQPDGAGGLVLKGGRADAVGETRGAFLERCVGPLVDACVAAADVVEALELVNEPEMLARSGVPRPVIAAFVREGVAFLRARCGDRLPVTVGYQFARTLEDRSLGAHAVGLTLPQFHFYGGTRPFVPGALPPARAFGALGVPIVGELPVSLPRLRWPPGERRYRAGLAARLALCRDRGYERVLLWSAQRARRDPFSGFWVDEREAITVGAPRPSG